MILSNIASLQKPKPFLKWVGGKTQLIPEIDKLINKIITTKQNLNYIEPFVGGGAILFHVLAEFNQINTVVINDINLNLINSYKLIKNDPQKLISLLLDIENNYYNLSSFEEKKEFYLQKREEFNHIDSNLLLAQKIAILFFLNKTCFNGLYRVNKKGQFNVPFGKYKKPKICNGNNIISVNQSLQKVTILNDDFENTLNYSKNPTLFYLDPPYKPIKPTSSFTSYSAKDFNDNDQARLKQFCDQINAQGNYFILSNSDVKNYNSDNNFFDDLYKKYKIQRVKAKRSINCKGNKRGKLFELLISNF